MSDRIRGANLLLRLQPEAIPLDPLNVEIEGRPARLVESGFYERLEKGWGTFFDPAALARNQAGYTQLSQLVPALENRAPSGCPAHSVPVFLDGRPVEFDGRPVDGPIPPVDATRLSATDIGAVEIYSSSAGLPLFALDRLTMSCGAVIMWSSWMTRPGVGEVPHIEVKLCEPGGRPGETTLEGTVEDRLSEVRLPAARVRASVTDPRADAPREIEVRTDSLGRFRLCDVPIGTRVTLAPSYGPHADEGTMIEALDGVRTKLTIQVTVPGSIVGRVLEEETGRPIRGQVPLTLVGTDYRTLSDRSGRFSFGDLPPGSYDIRADCGGFDSLQPRVEVSEAGMARVTVFIRKVVRGGRDRFRYSCDN